MVPEPGSQTPMAADAQDLESGPFADEHDARKEDHWTTARPRPREVRGAARGARDKERYRLSGRKARPELVFGPASRGGRRKGVEGAHATYGFHVGSAADPDADIALTTPSSVGTLPDSSDRVDAEGSEPSPVKPARVRDARSDRTSPVTAIVVLANGAKPAAGDCCLPVRAAPSSTDLVGDLKAKLAVRVGVPAEHLQLFYNSASLDDAQTLEQCGLADPFTAASRGKGPPVKLALLKGTPVLSTPQRATSSMKRTEEGRPTIRVPEDCPSLRRAVLKLPESGGIVQISAPPSEEGDVVDIWNRNVDIISMCSGGVDVRGARLNIRGPFVAREGPICARGLKNLDSVTVDGRSHGPVLLENCDVMPRPAKDGSVPRFAGVHVFRCLCGVVLRRCTVDCRHLARHLSGRPDLMMVAGMKIEQPGGEAEIVVERCIIKNGTRGVWALAAGPSARSIQIRNTCISDCSRGIEAPRGVPAPGCIFSKNRTNVKTH